MREMKRLAYIVAVITVGILLASVIHGAIHVALHASDEHEIKIVHAGDYYNRWCYDKDEHHVINRHEINTAAAVSRECQSARRVLDYHPYTIGLKAAALHVTAPCRDEEHAMVGCHWFDRLIDFDYVAFWLTIYAAVWALAVSLLLSCCCNPFKRFIRTKDALPVAINGNPALAL